MRAINVMIKYLPGGENSTILES